LSTVLAQREIDTPRLEMQRKIGPRNAAPAWRHSRLAVAGRLALFDRLGIEAPDG
jgi:hypothetical protein